MFLVSSRDPVQIFGNGKIPDLDLPKPSLLLPGEVAGAGSHQNRYQEVDALSPVQVFNKGAHVYGFSQDPIRLKTLHFVLNPQAHLLGILKA
ncbi:hypothetical protein JTM35_28105 [Pseudomonas aeruginosa]|nr:hypothetical protein [Pseudomonas aeruginosa]EKW5509218.1 hypothetical protein [Pseudomonas aeruginosa]EKW5547721.1 hypothetical protein [Pseudomonas aeruginosa]MBN0551069.1 hypothetical protein [Pseudomonas aeruginosa]